MVTVPEGMNPGDVFEIDAPWGAVLEVEVPPGTGSGSVLTVEP